MWKTVHSSQAGLLLLYKIVLALKTTSHVSPCGKINRTGPIGIINSPSYPKPFPNQIECEWSIQSSSQALLKIDILDLDLDVEEPCETQTCCVQHWLSVPFEGGRGSQILCGSNPPIHSINVLQKVTTIRYFSSELHKRGRGFSLRYTIDQVSCKPHEMQCRAGGCVTNNSRCNGVKDCADGSDEEGCLKESLQGIWCVDGSVPCPSTPKRCFSPSIQVCDGDFACPRGEDELGCAPGCPNQIACGSGDGCYEMAQRCNGVQNCRDNSDETSCESSCAPLQFICPQGGCISASALCDGVDDCGDMSDEQHCAKSFLLTAATLGLLACIILACAGICWLYRFYTAHLQASAAVFLHELEESESLDDDFEHRDPPPSYASVVAQSRSSHFVEIADSVPRVDIHSASRQRRRRSRRRRYRYDQGGSSLRSLLTPFYKYPAPRCPIQQNASSTSSISSSRESVTSSTSIDDLCQTVSIP